MPVAQSPAHYINSSKGCPSITESFPLGFFSTMRHRRGIVSGATPLQCLRRDARRRVTEKAIFFALIVSLDGPPTLTA
jgi:hypothetical protein